MRFIKALLLLALFVFSLLFFMQNMQPLSTPLSIQLNLYPTVADSTATAAAAPGYVNLNWKSDKVPLYFVVVSAFAVGVLFTLCFLLLDRIRLSFALMKRKGEVRGLTRQLKLLNDQMAKETKAVEARSIVGANEKAEEPETAASPAPVQ